MDRREALKLTALILGGTVAGSQAFLAGCSSKTRKTGSGMISAGDIPLLDEVGEIILPATPESPGAKAVKIGQFMNTIVTDCYTDEEQKIFTAGLKKLGDRSNQMFSEDFMALSADQRFQVIARLDSEATSHSESDPDHPHYFTLIKQLTIWGYFTSEPGCTQALRYIQTPGHYEGCGPYKKGDKAWAT